MLSAGLSGERCNGPHNSLGEEEARKGAAPWHSHPIFIQKGGYRFDSSLNPGFDVTTCTGRYKRKEGDLENASCLSQGLVRLL